MSLSNLSSRRLTLLAAGVTVIFWASAFPAIRAGLQAFSPFHVALLRYLTASLVLAIYALVTRMPLPRLRDLPNLALLGLIGFTLYNALLNWGEVTVPSAIASFIIAGAPIFMALFATFFFGERLRLPGWIGILISFVGVSVIAFSSGSNATFDPRALVILAAALAQSLYSVGQKPFLKRYSPIQFTSYAVWFGTLFLLVFAPGLPQAIQAAPADALIAVVYLGMFPGALGYATWSYVLAHLPASTAASFIYLVPAFALVIALIWLGEVPSLIAVFGGLLVVVGVIVVNLLGRARREPAPANAPA
jgi:drug/metabolite transporter (DMT)-like permease